MNMRPSVVLEKLRAGKLASCVKINTADPRVIEIAAMSGFDCVWTDMEHVGNDYSMIERQIVAAKAHNTDCMVRVARGSYSDHVRPLELDAAGIMVPHLMDLADARKVVWNTRFHPVGRRALDGGNADGAYCLVDTRDYIAQANRERFVVVQIEDPEPLADLEAICALDGIDMIFFGPADFSQGIGDPCNFTNPKLLEARRQVAECAVRHGKFAGTVGSPANLKELYGLGYRFVSVGADVVGLINYFKEMAGAFEGI
ncbi:2,4-dihydroxyhept-2-ene-1,7-dioic acid aldolase [Spirochaetia bacterium]|nr:2,4-dihydroxyhept-2-ene-1,7-dioic acid aldolase [Spirochaetia bacterium]